MRCETCRVTHNKKQAFKARQRRESTWFYTTRRCSKCQSCDHDARLCPS